MAHRPVGVPTSRDLHPAGADSRWRSSKRKSRTATGLDTLQGRRLEQQLDLACRTLLAALLRFRPDSSAPRAKCDALKRLCDGVEVWRKDEIAEMRRSQSRQEKTVPNAKRRQKVGHAQIRGPTRKAR
jgi:hypothetical protein